MSTEVRLINFYVFNPTLSDKESAVSDAVCSLYKNIRIHIRFAGTTGAKIVVLLSQG